MGDPKNRIAAMLRQVAQPVQMPRQAPKPRSANDMTEGMQESMEIAELPKPDPVNTDQIVERVATDNRTRDIGKKVFEKIARGDNNFSADEDNISEAIILLTFRPSIDIQNNTFGDVPPEWSQLADFRAVIDKAIRGAGRIELPNSPSVPYGGTGFVVGKNLLLTNRHVAEIFTSGVGKSGLTFRSHIGTAIDFRQEVGQTAKPRLLKVKKTVLIHPHWDAALLQVDGLEESQVLTLMANEPTSLEGRAVVVIGYPALDQLRNDLAEQQRIFRGVFNKKRLSPGKLMDKRIILSPGSGGNMVEAITHNSSTLGGNSGSLVLDLETGKVLGLHFGGSYMVANFAVPTWELANDKNLPRLNFDDRVRSDGFTLPLWLDAWGKLKVVGPGPVPPEAGQRTAVADWFERTTTDELAAANRRDPEGTQALLRETLHTDEAESLIADLQASEVISEVARSTEDGNIEEGLFSPRVDPTLPEIVFLHGITGCHLSGANGFISRIWLNPLAFVSVNIAKKLSLDSDGKKDAQPGSHLVADGHIRFVYERATRSWERAGFVVHPFSFDWRKGIAHAADRLHLFLENLQLERPSGKPVVLVAHSMGGLVASLYAQRHPEWKNRVSQAIFMGSPIRGSFAPVSAVLGTYSFLKKLARLSLNDDMTDLQRMASTLPGLLDMMPDPLVFTDVDPVYELHYWPQNVAPTPGLLKQSKDLKPLFAQSPLLKVTTGIVSLVHGTVASLQAGDSPPAVGPATGVGDGTVPGRSAVIAGRPNFKAKTEHANLPRDPDVIQAVIDLIKSGICRLDPLTAADDLNATLPAAESLDPIPLEEAMIEAALAINGRMENGIFTQKDYDWLVGV